MLVNFCGKSDKFLMSYLVGSMFFRKMSEIDLRARGSKTSNEYLNKYCSSILDFTLEERNIIFNDLVFVSQVEPRGLQNIKWNLVKVGNNIEGNMCHTLGGYIVLTPDWFRRSENDRRYILLHEKIHVFQRLYPHETDQWIQQHMGFFPQDVIYDRAAMKRLRNNPDLNGKHYGNNPGEVYVELYHSDNPKNLHDSSPMVVGFNGVRKATSNDLKLSNCVSQLEHPYEMMASYLSRLALGLCHGVPPEERRQHLMILNAGPNIF